MRISKRLADVLGYMGLEREEVTSPVVMWSYARRTELGEERVWKGPYSCYYVTFRSALYGGGGLSEYYMEEDLLFRLIQEVELRVDL